MIKFFFKRISYGFFVLFGVAVVVFFIFNILPGDPVALMVGQNGDATTRALLTKELGLDQPTHVQLGYYLNDISPLSVHKETDKNAKKYGYVELLSVGESVLVFKFPYFRRSYQSDKPVADIISESIVPTFWLAFTAMLFASIVGIIMGILAALNQNTWWDNLIVTISVSGISTPSFVAGIILALVFGHYLAEYTGLSSFGSLFENSGQGRELVLKNLILPAITLGIRPLAIIVQLTRSSMLDVLSQDYIRTARAKGLSKFKVIFKHALKNALNPVVTSISGFFASLLAGAIIIERIFNWNGIGDKALIAVEQKDLPVVMGCTLFIASMFIFINIFVDVLYQLLDPRVKLS